MKAWLKGDYSYLKVVIEPKLQRQLEGTHPSRLDILAILKRQVLGAIEAANAGKIIGCRFEMDGDNIEVGIAAI